MSHSSITVNAAVAAATFATSRLPHTYQAWQSADGSAGNPDGILDQLAKWKDHIDAAIDAIQARVATDAAITVEDFTVTDLLTARRFSAMGGTQLNADGTDFTLSAGFGTGRAVVTDSVRGNASMFRLLITPGSTPAANPTVTLTYPGGARASSPVGALVSDYGSTTSAGAHSWTVVSVSDTAIQVRHLGTPVEAENVGLCVMLFG